MARLAESSSARKAQHDPDDDGDSGSLGRVWGTTWACGATGMGSRPPGFRVWPGSTCGAG